MTLISFNINGIRARLHQLQAVIDKYQPAMIGLQETKVHDPEFPEQAVRDMGYHPYYFGQKGHYGVALITHEPLESVQYGFPTDAEDAQRRMIIGTLRHTDGSAITVLNGYFPQGENREHPLKFPAKEKFYQDLQSYLDNHQQPDQQVAVMGDFNISSTDLDIGERALIATGTLGSFRCAYGMREIGEDGSIAIDGSCAATLEVGEGDEVWSVAR